MATSLDIPSGLKERMEDELEEGMYSSKAELIRAALRNFLSETGLTEREKAILKLLAEGRIDERRLSEEAIEDIQKAQQEEDGRSLVELG